MNIVMVTHYFSPRIGGVEKVVEELAKGLYKHKLFIVTEKYKENLKDREKYNNWTTVYRLSYPLKKYMGLLFIWRWFWKNRKLIRNADLVHIHDVFIWYLPFVFLFPFKPVYITYHGWEGKLPIPWSSLLQKKVASYLSNGVVVVGKHLEKYNTIKADIVSYNGVDIPHTKGRKVSNSFVYVGRLSEETGLNLILKTINKLKKVNVEFCGDGELSKVCENYGKVHGFVDPSLYYAKAEFCFAGGILGIQEALANKCLVFVMYQNAIKEEYFKLAPFAKYIIVENSPAKMAEKIKYYQTHKRERIKKVEEGYEWVQGQTWEKLILQYENLWKTAGSIKT